MEPSTFKYKGLEHQKRRNYDNFLRSNIDNEQDNRNFNSEAAARKSNNSNNIGMAASKLSQATTTSSKNALKQRLVGLKLLTTALMNGSIA